MKLVSFQIETVFGPVVRLGAVGPDGAFVDLATSYARLLEQRGATTDAATRIATALIPADMVAFIAGGEPALNAASQALELATTGDALTFQPETVLHLAPVPRPTLIRDFMAFETHLRNIYPRLGREIPPEWYNFPVYYKGNPSSIGAPGQDIAIPAYADTLDYEFEMAIVIGKAGQDIPAERAMEHVFGYMIYNDFSERVIQSREMSVGLGPAKGKDFSNAHVFGPWLVTRDEIPDPYALRMTSRLNGETNCDSSSSTIHWRIEQMIAHASMSERLVVGEIFGTGTVGDGSLAERGESLARGDVIELEITGLGLLRNRVV